MKKFNIIVNFWRYFIYLFIIFLTYLFCLFLLYFFYSQRLNLISFLSITQLVGCPAQKETVTACYNEKYHLSKYFSYKKVLYYTYCDFIHCSTTVLHGIYLHKYRLYEFQKILWSIILFKRCCKIVDFVEITGL